MSKVKTALSLLHTPGKTIIPIADMGMLNWIPDKEYLQMVFRAEMGKKLNLKNPRTFNEKLQWLKLYNRNPNYPQMVDKCTAKEYVANIIGEQYIIPTLGIWHHFEDINFSILPEQFVIKCTHDSASTIICKDKKSLNIEETKMKIESHLKKNTYSFGREWPYKDLKPRIIAEKYLQNCSSMNDDCQKTEIKKDELTDYKFYCFNGYVDCVMICFDRESNDTKFYFFDHDWKLKRINKRGMEAPDGFSLPRPSCLDEMFRIASSLSQGIPFVRVDLYQSDKQVFFGEMTFFPQSGFDSNYRLETDLYFGNLIDLSLAYNYSKEHTNI